MTRILSEYRRADPRMDTSQERPSSERTVMPGTQRSASGIEVAPDRRISSAVSTKTEAGDLEIFCALRPTEVTCTLKSSSTPTLVKSSVGAPTDDLTKVGVDELFSVQVTSVGRKAQKISKSPASVFVLTAEDI